MEREACVCDHGFERSDLCAEIIIIIIIIIPYNSLYEGFRTTKLRPSCYNLLGSDTIVHHNRRVTTDRLACKRQIAHFSPLKPVLTLFVFFVCIYLSYGR